MLTHFSCPECGLKLSVSATLAGRRTRCPTCSQLLTVPGAASAEETAVEVEPIDDVAEPEEVRPLPQSAAKARAAVDGTAAAEAQAFRPPRKRRWRSVLFVVIALLVGVALLIGAVAVGLWIAGLAEGTLGRRRWFEPY